MTLINAESIPFADMHYRPDDEISEAVKAWNEGQVSLFDFSCVANSIVGKRDGGTERLANEIQQSVDTIERYAACGYLWLEMLKVYPKESEIYRDDPRLSVSHWSAIGAKLKAKAFDVSGAKHWIEETISNKWTVEKLRSMLPTKTIGESPFTRAAKKIVDVFEKDILNAPALNSGMNDREYKAFIKTAEWLVRLLKGTVLNASKENTI